jgi:hypothetical protein
MQRKLSFRQRKRIALFSCGVAVYAAYETEVYLIFFVVASETTKCVRAQRDECERCREREREKRVKTPVVKVNICAVCTHDDREKRGKQRQSSVTRLYAHRLFVTCKVSLDEQRTNKKKKNCPMRNKTSHDGSDESGVTHRFVIMATFTDR